LNGSIFTSAIQWGVLAAAQGAAEKSNTPLCKTDCHVAPPSVER